MAYYLVHTGPFEEQQVLLNISHPLAQHTFRILGVTQYNSEQIGPKKIIHKLHCQK